MFSPDDELETLPAFAGYVTYQHWWNERARSTMNLSWVNVSNQEYQIDESYKKTFRGAVNYIYSPTARVDLGAELIWGKRTNKDQESATAAQIRLSTKYRF